MQSLHERYTQSVSHLCFKVIDIGQTKTFNVSVNREMVNALISKLKGLLNPTLYNGLISSGDQDREKIISGLEDLTKTLKALDLNNLISAYPSETENIVELIEEICEMVDDTITFHTLASDKHFTTTFESLDI